MIATIVIAAFLAGWLGTILVERSAQGLSLVQAPNARSSHSTPTPRGGGLAIAVASVLAALTLGLWPIAALVAVIAALGFADDLWDLSPALRFPVQSLVFAALLSISGALPTIALPLGLSISGPILAAIVLLAGLWWLNLFNFMDGIDGMAGSQAILLLSGATLIWWSTAPEAQQSPILALALAVAMATAGFLLRNWPPARIFMGDAGSNALALLVFAVALATIVSGQVTYQSWLILPATFVTDATVTLLRRLARGERPWHAHRRHAYQQLARLWGHHRVTLAYCALTAFWCFPMALAAQYRPELGWWLALLAYLPMVALALRAGAGDHTETGA